MGSTRLPGKVLMKVNGVSLLEYLVKRVRLAKRIDNIVIATTDKKEDDKIINLCEKINLNCFRGSDQDVLDRYYKCSLKYPGYNQIIRITGDCPLVDPELIDKIINFYENNNFDYAVNPIEDNFPDGLAAEIFKKDVLFEAARRAKLSSEREHMTLYLVNNQKYKKGYFKAPQDYSSYRFTVDEPADLEVVKWLIAHSKITDNYLKYIKLLENNPRIRQVNINIRANEGLKKSISEDKVVN